MSHYYAHSHNKNSVLIFGPIGGAFAIFFGLILIIAAVAGTGWWFWILARDYPNQPPKYTKFVNIGLLTILPTIALIVITWVVTLGGEPGEYGERYYMYDAWDIVPGAMSLLILQYAVFRGDCVASARKWPATVALSLILASGLCFVEVGRQACGKGFDDTIEASVTGWEAIDDDTSLVTLNYMNRNGRQCSVSLELDCTKYWVDIERSYRDQDENDDGDDDEGEGDDNANWNWRWYSYWDEENPDSIILSEIKYSDGSDRQFTCRNGFDNNDDDDENEGRRLEEYQYGDESQAASGDFSVIASVILINSHTCKASWFTNERYEKDFIWENPEKALWICLITAVVVGMVYLSWQFCPQPGTTSNNNDDRTKDLLESEKAAEAS